MSVPTIIHWPPVNGNQAAIASAQAFYANQSLRFNPNIGNAPPGPYLTSSGGNFYAFDKIARQITLTSTQIINGVQFTVTGIGADINDPNFGTNTEFVVPDAPFGLITETFAGPNNNTVGSHKIYSEIHSIIPDSNSALNTFVSVGFGGMGVTDYVFLDHNRVMAQSAVQLFFVGTPTNTKVSLLQSLNKPAYTTPNGTVNNFFPGSFPAFFVSNDTQSATTDQLVNLVAPIVVTWGSVKINNFATNDTDEFYLTVLQQGI